jgi:hypothetical protein
VERWPAGRLNRRARARVEFLEGSLRTGAAPLVEFQTITSGRVARAEAIARMEKLVAAHPEFALADRALFWLGQALIETGREADGTARWDELARRFPSSEWRIRAEKARADRLLERGHPLAARRIFESLAGRPEPLARAFAEAGLAQSQSALRRTVLYLASLAYFALFLAAHAFFFVRLRERPRLPLELVFYLPVATLFCLAGATENVAIGVATLLIAAGGGLILFSALSLASARQKKSPLTPKSIALHATLSALAALAVAYSAIHATRLTDLVLETLKMGPER